MKVSLNWLRELVCYEGSVDDLAATLTFAGVEVESVQQKGFDSQFVVVARIVASEKHPDADRLSVCQVEDGSSDIRQIVCGAKNYKVGDKVPLALPGAVLPGGLKIKKGKLRGVVSDGMLCSGSELGIPDDANGLLILPGDAPVGCPISAVIPCDTVLEIEVTPNRPDLLSYHGIAREIAALTGAALKLTAPDALPYGCGDVDVATEAPAACPYYTATRIRGVKVGPSPDWLSRKLQSVGMRPINVIVDITNFVLLETGQPLHAFDAAKIHGSLSARFARQGEQILALDGQTYDLTPNHLVIADADHPVAIAGVMGGETTGVTHSTTEVLLESAYFAPGVIRASSRSLGLASESSYRFERGVDPAGIATAAARAARLIVELAGGEIIGGIHQAGHLPQRAITSVTLRDAKVASVVGYPLPRQRSCGILEAFGLQLADSNNASTTWLIPSWRGDLQREIDLVEEIVRVEGLDKVPETQASLFTPATCIDRSYDFRIGLARSLVATGFFEARTLTLVSESMLEDDIFTVGSEPLRVRNPLGEDSAALRPSLLPGLLQCAARNVRHGAKTVRLFEIGRVFHSAESGSREEEMRLAMVATGQALLPHWSAITERLLDLFDLKGAIESLLSTNLLITPCQQVRAALAGRIEADGVPIGFLGQVAQARARALDINSPLVVAEINLETLESILLNKAHRYHDIPKFPSTSRDLALVVPMDTRHQDVLAAIQTAKEPLLSNISVFDVFSDPEGKKIPLGKKSLAYSLTFASTERTLNTEEVNAAHERIKQHLIKHLGAAIRE